MRLSSRLIVAAAIAVLLLPGRAVQAADDKERVLRQLDAAAAKFRNTTADFQFHSIQTDPVPDEDVQEGTVYYERNGANFQMAGHIKKVNQKPLLKVYTYSKGVFQLFEKAINQITLFKTSNSVESYLRLGFGASGKDLESSWEVKYLGSETLKDGNTPVRTEKLDLVPRDQAVRKNIAHVTIWIDPERAVSMKQIFYENSYQRRECFYFNVKVNAPQPADAYTLPLDPKSKPNVISK
jgi:outer membrane lipoprotein-sorting protein